MMIGGRRMKIYKIVLVFLFIITFGCSNGKGSGNNSSKFRPLTQTADGVVVEPIKHWISNETAFSEDGDIKYFSQTAKPNFKFFVMKVNFSVDHSQKTIDFGQEDVIGFDESGKEYFLSVPGGLQLRLELSSTIKDGRTVELAISILPDIKIVEVEILGAVFKVE